MHVCLFYVKLSNNNSKQWIYPTHFPFPKSNCNQRSRGHFYFLGDYLSTYTARWVEENSWKCMEYIENNIQDAFWKKSTFLHITHPFYCNPSQEFCSQGSKLFLLCWILSSPLTPSLPTLTPHFTQSCCKIEICHSANLTLKQHRSSKVRKIISLFSIFCEHKSWG